MSTISVDNDVENSADCRVTPVSSVCVLFCRESRQISNIFKINNLCRISVILRRRAAYRLSNTKNVYKSSRLSCLKRSRYLAAGRQAD